MHQYIHMTSFYHNLLYCIMFLRVHLTSTEKKIGRITPLNRKIEIIFILKG